ncbi:nucleopolyhedrovirus P10 family protein [Streptomyces sp. NPDC087300]|uniref:nucleopolyhedrovirus P10 family protein n=1 Tax=Streptomyces sp. NPDC087300 TaxID=3365780 RepID=UPI00382D0016
MTGDGWTQAVRRRLGLGRVLPLGGAADGTWVTEAAAGAVLRHAAREVPGIRVNGLRIALADQDRAYAAAVPPPPSALPPGPLRITAEVAASPEQPLPAATARLRTALSGAADRLGLVVDEVDLRVTALLDEGADPDEAADRPPGEGATSASAAPEGDSDAARAARAALAVPGVTRLTEELGPAVQWEEHPAPDALARRHARVEIATDREHRALDVALAVRAAVGDAVPGHPSVAVLVTAVE